MSAAGSINFTNVTNFRMARRTSSMNSSAIRELLKSTDRPGVLSLAGGLPSPDAFPVEALRQACDRVLGGPDGASALQYGASEGWPPLREWIAARLSRQGWTVHASRVLVTTGSQQGLDLLGKVLLDAGSAVLAENPTYLGALQAFSPYEPVMRAWAMDEQGPSPAELTAPLSPCASSASTVPSLLFAAPTEDRPRLAYLVPSFQNPTGHCIPTARRRELADACRSAGVPLVEDDPYGELWYDTPPPAPAASYAPGHAVYLGSFSKTLAPGLRLGFLVMPEGDDPDTQAFRAKLLQAKQACDLHTSAFDQRIAMGLLDGGFDLDAHLDAVRARYRRQRDAMALALARHLPASFEWALPGGGMFFWVTAPEGIDTTACLPAAIGQGVAYIPGAPFHTADVAGRARTLRLSFVTLSPTEIEEAVTRLARALRSRLPDLGVGMGMGMGKGKGLGLGTVGM